MRDLTSVVVVGILVFITLLVAYLVGSGSIFCITTYFTLPLVILGWLGQWPGYFMVIKGPSHSGKLHLKSAFNPSFAIIYLSMLINLHYYQCKIGVRWSFLLVFFHKKIVLTPCTIHYMLMDVPYSTLLRHFFALRVLKPFFYWSWYQSTKSPKDHGRLPSWA